MSTVSAIVVIVVLLGALTSYAFISQTLARRREQRRRLLAMLKARSRSFKFMLNGFPPGFLSRELTILVQRSLADTCEHLAKLEPGEPNHMRDYQMVSAQMAESQSLAPEQRSVSMESLPQVKEVKICLEELHKFVFQLEAQRALTRTQADLYRAQIKTMVLQVTVDSYVINAQQARQNDKTKLAIHYFELALNLMLREGPLGQFEGRIAQLKQVLKQLRDQLAAEEAGHNLSPEAQAEREDVAAEWDKFGTPDQSWKKKNIYD